MKITRAIVRHIDDSLAKFALRHETKSVVNLERARKQHENYVSILRDRCNLSVTYLPSSGLPDSVFIEDTAVIAHGKGVVTRPGAKSRAEETKEVAKQLIKDLSSVFELGGGSLDGGDVLFTGDRFLVGRSKRTNEEGIVRLQKAFPTFPVVLVDISLLVKAANKIQLNTENDHLLHLKSCCSMIGAQHLAVGGMTGTVLAKFLTMDFYQLSTAFPLSPQSFEASKLNSAFRSVLRTEEKPFIQRQHIIHLPDRDAANCLWINNTLIHRSSSEFPNSALILKDFCEQQGMERIEIEYDELAKVDGALTCCSLLF